MTAPLRGIDHVAVLVRDTVAALPYFTDVLGLAVTSSETLDRPHVRLTFLDAGNVAIQLVEPLDDEGPIAAELAARGEGVHHLCFTADDPVAAAARLSTTPAPVVPGSGRGRVSAFVPGAAHGLRLEVTEARP
jgi:methylmalonyl-CoA/ethylmalonyl-CoA epimerase